MTKTEQNKQITHDWIRAFNEQNIQNLLALYHNDAEHFSPKLKIHQPESNGFIKGKPAMKAWWADAFERLPSLQYVLVNLIVDDKQVFMEYLRKVDGEAEMKVGEVLEIEEGLIVKSRVC
jgi:hypothetical protein